MNNDEKSVARQVFTMISNKIMILRAEVDLLEAEGNGLRQLAADLIAKLEARGLLEDRTLNADAAEVVHHKWAEQAQRYNVEANTVSKILLDKSRQMLDLIQFLKTRLRALGVEIPDDDNDPLVWDEFIFEKDTAVEQG